MSATDFENSKDIIVVRALLELYRTEDSGRKISIRSGYRPNHVFEYYDDNVLRTHIGELQFNPEEMFPGETRGVTVYLLNSPFTRPYVTVDRQWWIHEGGRRIGTATILEILSFPEKSLRV